MSKNRLQNKASRTQPSMTSRKSPNSRFWNSLSSFLEVLGGSWTRLGALGCVSGALGRPLGHLLTVAWALLGVLGRLLVLLGASWAPLGRLLGSSWAPLGCLLGASWVIWGRFSKVSGRRASLQFTSLLSTSTSLRSPQCLQISSHPSILASDRQVASAGFAKRKQLRIRYLEGLQGGVEDAWGSGGTLNVQLLIPRSRIPLKSIS